jgi:hypothetical protein
MQLIKFKNKQRNVQAHERSIENGRFLMVYLTKHKKIDVKKITTNVCYAIILLFLKLNSTILLTPL